MIVIESKRKKPETIKKAHPNAILADVTCKSKYSELRNLVRFFHGAGYRLVILLE